MEEKTYKSIEIAETLGVSQKTIAKWVSDGKLKGYFEGAAHRRLMITETELLKFLDKKPRYKEIWYNPAMRQAPNDIKIYIQEKLKVLHQLEVELTTDEMLRMWSLRTEFDVDGFAHDLICRKKY